jgi:hypothetical protein
VWSVVDPRNAVVAEGCVPHGSLDLSTTTEEEEAVVYSWGRACIDSPFPPPSPAKSGGCALARGGRGDRALLALGLAATLRSFAAAAELHAHRRDRFHARGLVAEAKVTVPAPRTRMYTRAPVRDPAEPKSLKRSAVQLRCATAHQVALASVHRRAKFAVLGVRAARNDACTKSEVVSWM